MKRIKNAFFVSFCLLVALVIFNGCSENVGMPYQPEKEPAITLQKVAGLELYCNGRLVAIIDSASVTGIVTAKMNENSDIFEVEFFDESGDVIEVDPQLYRLAWQNDPAYATFEKHQEWTFCIYGQKTGVSTFELELETGSAVEFKSPQIPLKVQ